ncbi:MAG TPA: tetratricopeptide repeat protein [Vicinamibacterales bacterium]|nr:tetratricopeptide repeat protein [Vicinamibacterales bacterium]
MRTAVLAVVAAFAFSAAAAAQSKVAKSGTLEAKEANRHYQQGWDAIHTEHWSEAVAEFEQTIKFDPDFNEAYYSLGRAHMGEHEFTKAIAAYLKCEELYRDESGRHFNDELEAKRHLEDRILEVQTSLNQMRTTGTQGTQTQQLRIRELQAKLTELKQAHDRSENVSMDTSVPFYVSMSLGAAYFRNNQLAEAEREYKAALDANSGSGETHNNLAVLYLMTDRAELAQNEIKAAEQTGYKVNPGLKDDVDKRAKKGGGS